MSEDTLIQPITATVGYVRKTAVGSNYNNNEISLYLPVELPRLSDFDGDVEAYYKVVDAAIKAAYQTAKGHVLEQLNIPFEDKDGVITEKVEAHFPNSTQVETPRRAAAPAPTPASGGAAHPVFGTCANCGGTEWWDNREGKKNPKAPDGKCKNRDCGKGVWLKK